jgi:alcohol dehydrogenase (NADP+)
MEMNNDHNQTTEDVPSDQGRRNFIFTTALAAAAVGGSGILNSSLAQAASSKTQVAYGPYPVEGMAAYSPTGSHKLMEFKRRALGPKDVAIRIHYCGVCHSDIHTIRGDWGTIQYPQIVGHELDGEVAAIGSSVSKF